MKENVLSNENTTKSSIDLLAKADLTTLPKEYKKIIFNSITNFYNGFENLYKACPSSKGDWYFTGEYPTPGGNRVVNTAFVNFFEGNKKRAY